MKPTLIINQDVYDEIMFYVNKSSYEVSGMGKVVVEPGGVLRVVSQIMLPQKNRSTHTQVEPEDINRLLFEMEESPRFWWHSHVMMGVFWSGEDMDTIKMNAGPDGWFINTVFNQKKEMKSAYYQSQGLVTPWGNNPIWYDDVETKIDRVVDPREAVWEEIYKKNVTNISVVSDWQKNYGMGNSGVSRPGEHHASSPSTKALTKTVTTHGSNGTTINFDERPPEKRPPWMKKKLYKSWVEGWNRKAKNAASVITQKQEERTFENFGFTPFEQECLMESIYTEDDVEALWRDGFSHGEIVELADYGERVDTIQQYIAMRLTPEQILTAIREDMETLDAITASDEAGLQPEKLQVGL